MTQPTHVLPPVLARLNFAAILLRNKTHAKLRLALPVEVAADDSSVDILGVGL